MGERESGGKPGLFGVVWKVLLALLVLAGIVCWVLFWWNRFTLTVELEGEEGLNHLDEYADSSSERGKAMRKAIAEKFHFSSLDFQTLEGVIEAIGLDPCKLCTYCWNGQG